MCLENKVGAFQGVCHGLLQGDMLACLRSRDGHLFVQKGWGQHLDGVDLWICKHLVVIQVGLFHLPLLFALLQQFCIGIAYGV